MIGDHYTEKWREYPWWTQPQPTTIQYSISQISRKEFDALKKEVEDLKKLLIRAKAYDERNGEPDCEIEDKMALLRAVAKAVGVDLDSVLKPPA